MKMLSKSLMAPMMAAAFAHIGGQSAFPGAGSPLSRPFFGDVSPFFAPGLTSKAPGRAGLDKHHKKIGRSKYRPHQGSAEKFRRWKRLELARGDQS
ncbi:hypothetical protein [Roseibium album]|uniref:hypothetical protein n=1 Tax=Roseibium album TaxID=311410 RepID=UPI0024939D30|nr:hypothetical protein [Roseibium album]